MPSQMWYTERNTIDQIHWGLSMDKYLAVKREKEIIWDVIFSEINSRNYFIDSYLDGKGNEPQNKLIIAFLQDCKNELSAIKHRGQPMILRKYSYEKILNSYLEKKYRINNIEMKSLSAAPSEKPKEVKKYYAGKLEEVKKKYAEQLADKNGLGYELVRKLENEYQVECPYYDKFNCCLSDDKCSVFWDNCVRKDDYINYLYELKKKEEYQIKKQKEEQERKREEQRRQEQEEKRIRKKQEKEKKKQLEKERQEKRQREKEQQEKRNIFRKSMSPTEIKIQILQMNNPETWEFLNNISMRAEIPMVDLIPIYERIIQQCSFHNNGMCRLNKSRYRCNISQSKCRLQREFIEGTLNNKKRSISVNKPLKSSGNELPKHSINIKDFVVRRAVFKCMHGHHKIENIDAQIAVDSDGKKELIQIPAGYCRQCNTYFIMESTYQELKRKGIILCRITDEKTYMKGLYVNGMQLAQESVLMQYGYNVSQTEGLSQRARQKILALLIDNKALSKSEIISYLDFFISQRATQSRMQLAIAKWETDREFVENYRTGEYTKYGVNAIYRR